MNVHNIVIAARRNGANLSQVYLILALIEIGAHNTPFFAGMKEEDLIVSLLTMIRIKQEEFWKKYILTDEYDKEDFAGFLSQSAELKFDIDEFKKLMVNINREGEEHYEFKRIDRLDNSYSGQRDNQKDGPQGSTERSST